jgi:hypothetical protein
MLSERSRLSITPFFSMHIYATRPSYAKRLRRKRAILLAQIALSFHNKGPSIRAKNNDPLEVLIFIGLFERPFWLGWGVRDKPQR